MSGLRKAKKYNWKDTNLALFGSDVEKNIKKESAETEPAWKNAGKKVGLQIWRIEKFQVKDWPKEKYGMFYDGDSYIVLSTYKEDDSEELNYDVHFWIGKFSTQDEYGTAAYKTVELDTFLDDVPVQHREVQDHESDLFKSYFKNITILRGGVMSGFRHVEEETYETRLLHFCGTRKVVEIKEIPRCKDLLDENDVYILDRGMMIYQWNGQGSNKDERFKAMQHIIDLKNQRAGKPQSEVLEQESTAPDHEFYTCLDEEKEDEEEDVEETGPTELYRLSDQTGNLKFKLEKQGSISKGDLDSKDVFVIDTKKMLFVWIGKDSSNSEKKNAMTYAHKYLQSKINCFIPISCCLEGSKSHQIDLAFAA